MTFTELSLLDEEVLQLITGFEAATERHIEDALSQAGARRLLGEVVEYEVAPLSEGTLSLISQLQRALPPVPNGDWRSHVSLLANEAKRQLLAAGKAVAR